VGDGDGAGGASAVVDCVVGGADCADCVLGESVDGRADCDAWARAEAAGWIARSDALDDAETAEAFALAVGSELALVRVGVGMERPLAGAVVDVAPLSADVDVDSPEVDIEPRLCGDDVDSVATTPP
jgi:hypothetical protein